MSVTNPAPDVVISPSVDFSSSEEYDAFNPYDLFALAGKIKDLDEKILLKKHGYTKKSDIIDTINEEIFVASNGQELVTIKKIPKTLQKEKKYMENGFTFLTDTNIVKETSILKAIAEKHDENNPFMIKHINSFTSISDDYYYLVTEYVEDSITLKEFVHKAHSYINNCQLQLKDYRKCVTSVLYQLATTIYSLHNVHKCCHLNISPDNILLQQWDFIQNDDQSVIINSNIQMKLIGFGFSEQFEAENEQFKCNKQFLNIDNEQYLCPDVENYNYDARGIDVWAFGMTMYYAYFGTYPYETMTFTNTNGMPAPAPGTGFSAVMNGTIKQYLVATNQIKFVNRTIVEFLNEVLDVNSRTRLNSEHMFKHKLFSRLS